MLWRHMVCILPEKSPHQQRKTPAFAGARPIELFLVCSAGTASPLCKI